MSPEYVGFAGAVKLFFRNYTNFKGRSTRSEYWWWSLALLVIFLVLIVALSLTIYTKASYMVSAIMMLFSLAIIVPNIALIIRRLHDIGKSGWWYLISCIPLGGAIVLLVFTLQPSDGPNKWGEPAKA